MFAGLLTFAGATLLLAMSPGPASVLVMRQTLYGGQRMAALSILGIASGLMTWMALAAAGLTALVTGSHETYVVIRIIGAVVLAGLGTRTLILSRRHTDPVVEQEQGQASEQEQVLLSEEDGLTDGGSPTGPGTSAVQTLPARKTSIAPAASKPRTAYQTGLLTCLTNPKVAIFAAALLPQFVSTSTWSGWVIALYALVWAATSSTWYLLLTVLLRRARWIYERPVVRRRLEQLSGLILLGFGLRIALQAGS